MFACGYDVLGTNISIYVNAHYYNPKIWPGPEVSSMSACLVYMHVFYIALIKNNMGCQFVHLTLVHLVHVVSSFHIHKFDVQYWESKVARFIPFSAAWALIAARVILNCL